MSGVGDLRDTLLAALRADAALMGLINSIEDGATARYAAPALIIGSLLSTDWGAKGVDGLSVRVPLTLVERGDRPDRQAAAEARVAAVMDGLPDMAGDWRIGVVRLDTVRTLVGADGETALALGYLVRLSRTR